MLRAQNLVKQYATVRAVGGVSLAVDRGQILGLLGPNGAGKTTCIRMILNIIQPDAGTITFDGRPFSHHVRNIVGYLPEERGLYKRSKVLDTIVYFGTLRGLDAGLARAESYQWLQRFGLLDVRDRRVDELSKGNQQKVQFIAAVIHNPDLVILDEPFSGLDPINQVLFKDVMQDLKRRGKAIIFSTHQMDAAERLSDALCLINKGSVVLEGYVSDVKRRYGLNALHLEFVGDGALVKTLRGIRRAIVYENSAEVELEPGTTSRDVLAQIMDRLELKKFEVVEPSLHSIFMQVVGSGDPVVSGVA